MVGWLLLLFLVVVVVVVTVLVCLCWWWWWCYFWNVRSLFLSLLVCLRVCLLLSNVFINDYLKQTSSKLEVYYVALRGVCQ